MEIESNDRSSQTETDGLSAPQAMYSPPDILLGDPGTQVKHGLEKPRANIL